MLQILIDLLFVISIWSSGLCVRIFAREMEHPSYSSFVFDMGCVCHQWKLAQFALIAML